MSFQDAVNQSTDLIVASFQERHPEFDLRTGTPLFDLLVNPFKDLAQQIVEVAERRLMQADITKPDELTEEEWDKITAIHFMPRKAGRKSSGTVRLYYRRPKEASIPLSERLSIDDRVYLPKEEKRVTPAQFSPVVATPATTSKETNGVNATIVALQETDFSSIAGGTYVLSVLRGEAEGSYVFRYNDIDSVSYSQWPSNQLIEMQGGQGAGKLVLACGPTPPSSLPAQDFVVVTSAVNIYGVDIDVEAESEGSDSEAPVGAPVTPSTLANDADFIRAESITLITGGFNKQTNADNLEDIRSGIGVRNLINRRSIRAVLRDRFPQIEQLVVVGYQEPEMRRDRIRVRELVMKDGVMQPVDALIALGNKADVYVKTPFVRRVVQAVVSEDATVDLAQFGVVLKVHSLTLPSSPGQLVFYTRTSPSETLWLSARDEQFLFVDPSLIGRTVQLDITQAPDITDIQSFVESDDHKILLGDLLVRAFIPVWVSGIIYVSGLGNREAAVKRAIAQYFDTLKPGDPLPLSGITSIIQSVGVGFVVQQYSLTAEIQHANGTREEMISEEVLEMPSDENHARLGFTPRVARWVFEALEIVDLKG